ncbi:MAG: sigma 54-interacting transcriptional regulator [Bryobacteraceae bacterium]
MATAEIISVKHDPDTLFRDLADRLQKLIELATLQVTLYRALGGAVLLSLIDPPQEGTAQPGAEDPTEDSPSRVVWREQQPLIISAANEGLRFPKYVAWMHEVGLRHEYIMPVSSAGKRLGAIGFGSRNGRPCGESELKCLQLIAKEYAVAMDDILNLREILWTQGELTRERDRSRLLLEINNALLSDLDFDELWDNIAKWLLILVPHEFSGMALYDAQMFRLRTVGSRAREHSFFPETVWSPIQGTSVALALASGRPLVVNLAELDQSIGTKVWRDLVSKECFGSGCILPLISHNRKLGILVLASRREDAFGREDLEMLSSVAAQISIAVENAVNYRELESLKNRLRAEKQYLDEEVQTACDFELIGNSEAFLRILKQIELVAPTDSTILLQGETGTGKELIAQAIHKLSGRRERTQVKVNCSAIPTGLLESEFFGHEKGAFTGAIARRIGRFELAHQGTLFLDEIGDIPRELQPKLLRVLQEKEFERVGGSKTIRVDVRLVAATNADLAQLVADKEFRADLYYRLNVFPITIPPLRERPHDIIALAERFTQSFARRMKKRVEAISPTSRRALTQYRWPGNIRELQNVIERAVILSQGPVLEVPLCELTCMASNPTLEGKEREYILGVLNETNWVVSGNSGAARRLGLNRSTLQSKMRKLGISRPK